MLLRGNPQALADELADEPRVGLQQGYSRQGVWRGLTHARDAIHTTAEDPMNSLVHLRDDHQMELHISKFQSINKGSFALTIVNPRSID